MVRSEAMKKAQKKYRQVNKERYNNNVREYNRKYMLEHYDEKAKQYKKDYYFKNKNYTNKNFAADLIKLFAE